MRVHPYNYSVMYLVTDPEGNEKIVPTLMAVKREVKNYHKLENRIPDAYPNPVKMRNGYRVMLLENDGRFTAEEADLIDRICWHDLQGGRLHYLCPKPKRV